MTAWAFAGECEPCAPRSNTFRMEWPPKSGLEREFPEVDRAEFFTLDGAKQKADAAEYELLVRLASSLT